MAEKGKHAQGKCRAVMLLGNSMLSHAHRLCFNPDNPAPVVNLGRWNTVEELSWVTIVTSHLFALRSWR